VWIIVITLFLTLAGSVLTLAATARSSEPALVLDSEGVPCYNSDVVKPEDPRPWWRKSPGSIILTGTIMNVVASVIAIVLP
jgi:hypothetical protein